MKGFTKLLIHFLLVISSEVYPTSGISTNISATNMLPVTCNLRWLFFWIFTAVCALNEAADWKIAVKVDRGITEITANQSKFALDPDGSLILKNIQEKNDHNWCRCFYKERFVGLYHRSTIIFVFQEPVIITSDMEYVVTEDMPIVMFSDVIGYPSPWVAWIRNGQVLQNKTNGKNYILYGRHATIEDAGNYTCMAGNFAGVTSFTYQLIIMERPTAESKPTSQTHEESKGPSETQSTVERPTAESTPIAVTPSAGTTRKANQTGLCPGDGVAIGLGCAIVVAIGFAVTRWCVKRRRQNHLRDVVVRFQEVSTSDNHAIEITDKQ